MKEAFDLIKEKIMQDRRIGRSSLEAFLEILKEVEAEYGSGWIPVEKALPEAYDIVSKPILERPWYLVSRKCGSCAVASYEKVLGNKVWFGNSIAYHDVIAWMPLPEPYKPEKGAQDGR